MSIECDLYVEYQNPALLYRLECYIWGLKPLKTHREQDARLKKRQHFLKQIMQLINQPYYPGQSLMRKWEIVIQKCNHYQTMNKLHNAIIELLSPLIEESRPLKRCAFQVKVENLVLRILTGIALFNYGIQLLKYDGCREEAERYFAVLTRCSFDFLQKVSRHLITLDPDSRESVLAVCQRAYRLYLENKTFLAPDSMGKERCQEPLGHFIALNREDLVELERQQKELPQIDCVESALDEFLEFGDVSNRKALIKIRRRAFHMPFGQYLAARMLDAVSLKQPCVPYRLAQEFIEEGGSLERESFDEALFKRIKNKMSLIQGKEEALNKGRVKKMVKIVIACLKQKYSKEEQRYLQEILVRGFHMPFTRYVAKRVKEMLERTKSLSFYCVLEEFEREEGKVIEKLDLQFLDKLQKTLNSLSKHLIIRILKVLQEQHQLGNNHRVQLTSISKYATDLPFIQFIAQNILERKEEERIVLTTEWIKAYEAGGNRCRHKYEQEIKNRLLCYDQCKETNSL